MGDYDPQILEELRKVRVLMTIMIVLFILLALMQGLSFFRLF
ncbi:MAG: hypothetical protein Q8R04_00710 [Nanoarchaeota archaeon]|nr:hypothetical protein [Nanoarchaeota archaeon]